jgi:hypothetical protein
MRLVSACGPPNNGGHHAGSSCKYYAGPSDHSPVISGSKCSLADATRIGVENNLEQLVSIGAARSLVSLDRASADLLNKVRQLVSLVFFDHVICTYRVFFKPWGSAPKSTKLCCFVNVVPEYKFLFYMPKCCFLDIAQIILSSMPWDYSPPHSGHLTEII